MYTVSMPVRPYVVKYIMARYQTRAWEINKNERLGKILYNMLERPPKKGIPKPPELGASLDIKISYWYYDAKGIHLSNEAIRDFNDYIRLELIEEIVEYLHKLRTGIGVKKYQELFISQRSSAGKIRRRAITDPHVDQYFEIKEVIYDVFKQYNITEDDYPFENIKKDIQRLKLPLLTAC